MAEKKISPAMIIVPVVGVLGLAGVVWAITKAGAEEPKPEVYVCPYCGNIFATQEALDWHVANIHPGEEPPELEDVIYSQLVVPDTVYAGEPFYITVYVYNPNPITITKTVELTGDVSKSTTVILPPNSGKEANFPISIGTEGTYTVFVGSLSGTVTVVSSEPPENGEEPDQSGIFEISPGVYETRWPNGEVISTTYVTNTEVYIDKGAWGEPQVFPSGTKKYDVIASYFAAKVDGVDWSQGYWDTYIGQYYYVRQENIDWSDWDESSMSGRRTAYYWFTDLIPRFCPLTWNP